MNQTPSIYSAPPQAAPGTDLIDADAVAMIVGLGLASRLYPTYFATIEGGVAELVALGADGDGAALLRLAHRLRGASAQVGASQLAEALAALEASVEDGEPARAQQLLAGVGSLASRTIVALERALASQSA